MPVERYALFETSMGRCGVAWGPRGLLAVQLPERTVRAARTRVLKMVPGAEEADPPPAARRAIDLISSYLAGEASEIGDITLDMSDVPDGDRRVYEALRETALGSRVTYGVLAREAGPPATARSVGAAMGRNRFAPVVPCHRVVAADGRLGGFSAHGGLATKLRLLAIESRHAHGGAAAGQPKTIDAETARVDLGARDEVMARVIQTHGPCRLELMQTDVFSALVRAIVFQQLHARAAAAIHGRLLALLNAATDDIDPRALLRATDKELRAAGLSPGRSAALRELAQATSKGVIPSLEEAEALDDEAFILRITDVRGVGRWTAQMMLIFLLGRQDVLPSADFGVRAGFRAAYGWPQLPTPQELEEFGRAWAPHRTVASWYLWRVAEDTDSSQDAP